MIEQEFRDISWKENETRFRAVYQIAHDALDMVVEPFGNNPTFTLQKIKNRLTQKFPPESCTEDIENTLMILHGQLLQNCWLNIIDPRSPKDLGGDIWKDGNRIEATTFPAKILIENYLKFLAMMAGDEKSMERHSLNIAKIKREVVTD